MDQAPPTRGKSGATYFSKECLYLLLAFSEQSVNVAECVIAAILSRTVKCKVFGSRADMDM